MRKKMAHCFGLARSLDETKAHLYWLIGLAKSRTCEFMYIAVSLLFEKKTLRKWRPVPMQYRNAKHAFDGAKHMPSMECVITVETPKLSIYNRMWVLAAENFFSVKCSNFITLVTQFNCVKQLISICFDTSIDAWRIAPMMMPKY